MEILFCDRCHESIPDADLETGKAVRVGGRALHVPCAFRRAMPGPGRYATFFLALIALGVSVYVASRTLGKDESGDEARLVALRKDMNDSLERQSVDNRRGIAELRTAIQSDVTQAVTKARDDLTNAQHLDVERAVANLNGKVEAYTDAHLKRFEANERQLSEVAGWVKEVRDLANRSGQQSGAAATTNPNPPQQPPVVAPTEPAKPPTPTGPGVPYTAPTDPEARRRHDQEVDRWIERLKDPDNGVSFSATYKLKDLKDLRAVPALVETLQKHKDYYTRLGAATALGELKACDAVVPLIDALDDREDLVQTAAGEALTTITGRDGKIMVGLTKKERRQHREEWARWWKDNEAAVRSRLNQPGKNG